MPLTLVTPGYETSIECLPQDAVAGRLNCIGAYLDSSEAPLLNRPKLFKKFPSLPAFLEKGFLTPRSHALPGNGPQVLLRKPIFKAWRLQRCP
jgi:hypothetical protein